VTVIALASSIIISIGSLAWGFAQAGFDSFVRWVVIFGLIWLFTQWRGWGWFSSLGLIFVVLASAFGLWFELAPGWMFAAAIFALFAWDMSDFRRRMRTIAADDDARGMERRHIARVSLLCLAGLFLASIAMLVRVQFTFEWGALLVIVILLGLSQLVSWFRKQSK
jgi:hypothetical protein